MSGRRPGSRGLLLPPDDRPIDWRSALSQDLRSLWLPASGLAGPEIVNLVRTERYDWTAEFPDANATPQLEPTELGPALAFDGTADIAIKGPGAFVPGQPFVPNTRAQNTLAVAVRIDAIPSTDNVIYSFGSANVGFTFELTVGNGRTRLTYGISGRSTVAEIAATPTVGAVVLIAGVLDSLTSARISLYEPASGRFLTGSTSTGTITSADAANQFDTESLGGWYGGNSPSRLSRMALLDAWFWSRALPEEDLTRWRHDRWSVLRQPRRRAVPLPDPVRSATSTQQASAVTGSAAAKVITQVAAAHTTPLPTNQTEQSQTAALASAAVTPVPTQAAFARVRVQAASTRTTPLPSNFAQAILPAGDTTWDEGVGWDSGSIRWDGSGEVTASGIRLDATANTIDSTAVRFDGSSAPLGTGPIAVAAAQQSPAPTQAATGSALARAQAVQPALSPPTQIAEVAAPDPSASHLASSATLPTPTQAGSLASIARVQVAQVLLPPLQFAGVGSDRDTEGGAFQLLPPPTQSVTVVAGGIQQPPEAPPLPDQPVQEPVPVAVTGDLEDMVARQAAVLPPWFGAPGAVPDVLRLPLAMAGSVGAWLYELIGYARKQIRIRTATDGWLDLIANDFFGRRVLRRSGQGDDSFRRRIQIEMFRPRATRPAMRAVLEDLTGVPPRIFEPGNPLDTGGIGIPSGLGVGVAGAVGSIVLPGNVFIDAYIKPDSGVPFAAGIGFPVGGIGVPSRLVVASLEDIRGTLRDEDVYAAVEATRPVGTVAWVRISYAGAPPTARLAEDTTRPDFGPAPI